MEKTMLIEQYSRTINRTAKLAGALYLGMMPFAIFTLYSQFSTFVHGDATTTVNNIMAAEKLIRLGILSWLIQQIISILLVLTLYKLLKPVNKGRAVLMLVFALVGVPMSMLNELNQFAALLLLNNSPYFAAFTPEQIQAQVMLFLNLHEHGTATVHVFWGLWLFPMGYLVFKSGYIPKLLGILLLIAGAGYLVDMVTFVLLPGRGFAATGVTFLGELLFPLWLLFKGIDLERFQTLSHGL